MTFGEALDLMRRDRVVARRSWPAFQLNRGIAIGEYDKNRTIRWVNSKRWGIVWYITQIDILAMDWEVVDASVPKETTRAHNVKG